MKTLIVVLLFLLIIPTLISIIIILHILTYNDAEENIYNKLNGIENEEDLYQKN
jgi:hypothetical protein